MFTLAYPWLLILLIVPLLLGRLLPAYRQTRVGLVVPFLDRLARLSGSATGSRSHRARPPLVQRICLWGLWGCLILALARPQWLEDPYHQNPANA